MSKLYRVELKKAASLSTPWGQKILKGRVVFCKEGSRDHKYFAGNSAFVVKEHVDRVIREDDKRNKRKSRAQKRTHDSQKAADAAKRTLGIVDEETPQKASDEASDDSASVDLKGMLKADLITHAAEKGIELSGDENKREIIEKINNG